MPFNEAKTESGVDLIRVPGEVGLGIEVLFQVIVVSRRRMLRWQRVAIAIERIPRYVPSVWKGG